MTRRAAMNSLREPDEAVIADHPYASMLEVSARQPVVVETLDASAGRHEFATPAR